MVSGFGRTNYRTGGYDYRLSGVSHAASNNGAHSVLSEIEIKDIRLDRVHIKDKVSATVGDVLSHLAGGGAIYHQDDVDKYNAGKKQVFKDIEEIFSNPSNKEQYDGCKYILEEVKKNNYKYDIHDAGEVSFGHEAARLLREYPTFNGQSDSAGVASTPATSAEETKSSDDFSRLGAQFDDLSRRRSELDRRQDALKVSLDNELDQITRHLEWMNRMQQEEYRNVFREVVDMFEKGVGGKVYTHSQAVKLAKQMISLHLEEKSIRKSLEEEESNLDAVRIGLGSNPSEEQRLGVRVSRKIIKNLKSRLRVVKQDQSSTLRQKVVLTAEDSYLIAGMELRKIKEWAETEVDSMLPEHSLFRGILKDTVTNDIEIFEKGLEEAKKKHQTVTLWSDSDAPMKEIDEEYPIDCRSTGLPTLEGIKAHLKRAADDDIKHDEKVQIASNYFEKERMDAIDYRGCAGDGVFINTDTLRRYKERIERARARDEILEKSGDRDDEIMAFMTHSDCKALPTLKQMKILEVKMEAASRAQAERSAQQEEENKKGGFFSLVAGVAVARAAASAAYSNRQKQQRPSTGERINNLINQNAARRNTAFAPYAEQMRRNAMG